MIKTVIHHERGPETFRLVVQQDGRYRVERGGPYRPGGPEIAFVGQDAAYRALRSWGISEDVISQIPGMEVFAPVTDEPAGD